MRLAKAGFVYRLEDIDKATREGVNKQLGHKGRPYSLWKFKGGKWCKHSWKTMLYRLKEGTELKEGQSLDDDYKKVDNIPKSYKPRPRGIDIAEGVANASNGWYKYLKICQIKDIIQA